MRSWSVSSIRGFHACQLQWWFRRTGVAPEFTPVALVEGIVLHDALAHHLRGVRDGVRPAAAEVHALIEAAWFMNEAGVPIRYGKLDRDGCLDRLRRLYDHWSDVAPVKGDVVAVEAEVRAEFEGLELPMVGYVDLVLEREGEVTVVDFKVTANKPTPDHLLDRFDLQKLALTRGFEQARGTRVERWAWQHLVKTVEPQVVDTALAVIDGERQLETRRLASIVAPTVRAMQEIETGARQPVPTQAPVSMCGSCAWRGPCSVWVG